MKRALAILLAIVVIVPLAGVVAVQVLLSEGALRQRIQAAALNATGRELTVAGPIRLGWSLTPSIEASDVSMANPPGFPHPTIAHIDRISARIDLLALFSRRIQVNGLTLTAPDIRLERDAQGRPNWDFSRPAPSGPATPSQPGPGFSLDIGQVAVDNAHLAYESVDVTAPHVTYDPASARIAGDVLFRGTALHVAGTAWPTPDLHLEGSGLKLAVSGNDVSAEVADLSSLSAMAGTSLPPLHDLRFHAKTTVAAGTVSLEGLTLSSAQGDLAGTLMIAASPRPTLKGALTATRLDLDALTPPPAAPASATAPPSSPAPPAAASATGPLIPETPIPYASLRRADVDLQLNAAALTWRGRTYTKVVVHALAQDGKLRLDPASMALGDTTLSAQLQADAAAQTLAAKIAAPGLPAGPIATLLGGPPASGAVDLQLDMDGQGATLRAVAATLHGRAGLAMVDGEIDNAWVLDRLQDALRAANLPLAAGGDSKVRCAAIRIDADAGKLHLATLVLDTSKLTLEGGGDIDLGHETLDLHLRPTLRLGAALSVPVHVGGTLRAPKAALDPGAMLPGRVGISIGGPAPADSCGPALTLARLGQPGAAPSTPEPAARPLKPADLLRGLLR